MEGKEGREGKQGKEVVRLAQRLLHYWPVVKFGSPGAASLAALQDEHLLASDPEAFRYGHNGLGAGGRSTDLLDLLLLLLLLL